jgi:hypothetical protein
VTLPLTQLLKKRETSPRGKKGTHPAKWEWTRQAEVVFLKLKMTFTKAPILQHFDTAKPIIVQMDVSGFAIAHILNEFDGFGVLRPVNFYSRRCSSAEQKYDTDDQELLPIVETLKRWRHYLDGTNRKVLIQCDHKNLEYFQTSQVFSRRQARWSEVLSAYDIVIEHLEGSKNLADDPSRQPYHVISYERPVARMLAPVSVEP